jgi:hypothetical protein
LTVDVRVSDPLVPVIVTVYVPEEPMHESVLVPVLPSVTLVGVSVQVRPELGEIVAARLTVPVNPRTLVTTTVDVPIAPALTLTLVGVSLTVKSCTVTPTVVECGAVAVGVPVTVTV